MLSRVAESIYWMARYVERAENTARLVIANINLMLDLPRDVRPSWQVLVEISGTDTHFHEFYRRAGEREVLRFMLGDTRNPCSILSSLQLARENARTIRDIIPREAWEQLNSLHTYARQHLGVLERDRRFDNLRCIIEGAQTFSGIIGGSMTRDLGYDFLRLGRNLERADMTTRIVDVRSAGLPESAEGADASYANLQWMSVLRSLTAYQMYRREMQVRVSRPVVLRFLFQDRRFPRAFRFCVDQVESCLAELPRSAAALAIARRVKTHVEAGELETLEQAALHEFIDELQLCLAELHDAISASYFRLERRRQPREESAAADRKTEPASART